MKKTVVFDFDGVIHSYTSGWKGEDAIPDKPVEGIKEAIQQIRKSGYEVVVVSTRCSTDKGLKAVSTYLLANGILVDKVCKEKPPAIVYIDDRAICFDGKSDRLLAKIENFKTWYEKGVTTMPNELKPCPFCGGTDIRYSLKITGRFDIAYHASMYCNKCHCYGARTLTEKISSKDYKGRKQIERDEIIKQKAVEAWNRRVDNA